MTLFQVPMHRRGALIPESSDSKFHEGFDSMVYGIRNLRNLESSNSSMLAKCKNARDL
jgi:hypothetical protein